MHSVDLQPIPHEPALFIRDIKTIVITDLHIGIENELQEAGLYIPSQTTAMAQRLLKLISTYRPENIILLGDIKHTIPSSTTHERTDVKRFLETIASCGTVHIVPGNHDGGIAALVPSSMHLHSSDGCILDTIGFVHGHRWPNVHVMDCDRIIIGHTHPVITLIDRLGYRTVESCWLRGHFIPGKLHEKYPTSRDPHILVMPAFNPLCGGSSANTESLVGPLKTIIDVDNTQVYLLDGISLGKVGDI